MAGLMDVCDHSDTNWRRPGTCVKCGRPMPRARGRHVEREESVMALGSEMSDRVYHVPAGALLRHVRERMAAGEHVFEEGEFRARTTNMQNALEEPPDAVGWAMLELERQHDLMPDEQWQELRMATAAAIACAANLDHALKVMVAIIAGD